MTVCYRAQYLVIIVYKFGSCEKVKGKVFYGHEPPSGESTTTECGVNYQQHAVMYWSRPMGNS